MLISNTYDTIEVIEYKGRKTVRKQYKTDNFLKNRYAREAFLLERLTGTNLTPALYERNDSAHILYMAYVPHTRSTLENHIKHMPETLRRLNILHTLSDVPELFSETELRNSKTIAQVASRRIQEANRISHTPIKCEHLEQYFRQKYDFSQKALLHGDLHPHNILHSKKGAVFIDLDKSRIGSPLLDIGTYVATLMLEYPNENKNIIEASLSSGYRPEEVIYGVLLSMTLLLPWYLKTNDNVKAKQILEHIKNPHETTRSFLRNAT